MTSLSQSISTRTCALAASLFAALVVLYLYGYGEQLGAESWTITVCRTDSKGQLSSNAGAENIGFEKSSVEQPWPSFCKSKYGAINHLRIRTPPLDFQWLALNSSVSNVTLKGPTGDDVPLTKLGQLPLIDSTVYSLPNPFNFVSGQYQLFLSNETTPVSSFPLHPHGCSCLQSLEKFSERYGCSAQAAEIVKKSIAKWPKKSVTREIYEHPVIHDSNAILHLAIINNKLYCKKGNQRCPPRPADAGRSGQMTALIQRVLRKVKVPDVWLMWNLEDGPVLGAYAIQPVFSPSGSSFHRDLLLPTPYMVNSKFQGVDVYMEITAPPWEDRESKAYFLGSPTGGPTQYLGFVEGAYKMHPRMRAVELSKQRPDLIDATVTMALITDQRPAKNGSGFPVVDRLTENGLLQWENTGNREREFKYILDLPGNSAAWRLGSNIGHGAVTIKNRTPWNEFWHYLLDDGRNVRLTMDLLDDLFDIVEDAQRRDHDMKCIAREAQLMSLLDLRQEDLLCWVAHSLVELSSIMGFVPTLDDLDLVEIPDLDLVDSSLCKCTQ